MNRKEKILALLMTRGPASTEDLRQAIAPHMTRQAFWYSLKALQADGFVTVSGAGPSSRWFLQGPAAVRRHLETPWERRRTTEYDMSFLEDYVPNRTFFLGERDRSRLRQAGTPPAGFSGPADERVLKRFLVDLSWKSSSLEGNTYSLAETERLMKFGEEAEGRTREEAVMILNHRAAIEYICPNPDVPAISAMTLRNIHALVSSELLDDPMWEGALRTHPVMIGDSAYRPLNNPHRIREVFEMMVSKAAMIQDPFEQAFFLTVHLPFLQAFEDCNKRTSRISANIPLFAAGVSPVSFLEVSRRDYVDGLLGIYEMADVSLAREIFVEAYVKSASRYWSPSVHASAPSLAILENRDFIRNAVQELVRSRQGFDPVRAAGMVREKGLSSHPEVLEHIRRSIEGLHEGNLILYGLVLSDLERMRARTGAQPGPKASGGTGKKDGDGWTPPEPSPFKDPTDPFKGGGTTGPWKMRVRSGSP